MAWLWYVELSQDPSGVLAMLLDIAIFAVGAVVGAFSHKWLSAEFTKVTGASAQAVATDAVAAAKNEAKKL